MASFKQYEDDSEELVHPGDDVAIAVSEDDFSLTGACRGGL